MPTLLVLLKYPTPSRVKTRLAASLGPQEAADLYRKWIELVFARVQPLREHVRVIAYYSGAPLTDFSAWLPLADQWWSQPEGDLGVRLAAGFEKAHSANEPVVAIGTDCLDVDSELVREAFSRLANYDTVFGPTPDGGYYLVGTFKHLLGFFDGVRWSSLETRSSHIALCERNGWTVSVLPSRCDIDTIEDWHRYCAKVATG